MIVNPVMMTPTLMKRTVKWKYFMAMQIQNRKVRRVVMMNNLRFRTKFLEFPVSNLKMVRTGFHFIFVHFVTHDTLVFRFTHYFIIIIITIITIITIIIIIIIIMFNFSFGI
ncbi:hypothetical protein ANN_21186 [Periplaneta americana]|uniref:Uncharacterized protein n=1 Tax=Periplaneta americana TaxID=6978 RepID=A0ABQ8SF25_PERAM|nr:hypothetical protein ANN_21186 [Periplaneta americana]